VLLVVVACKKDQPPQKPMPAPNPLEALVPERPANAATVDAGPNATEAEREALFDVAPFTVHGKTAPANARTVELAGDSMKFGDGGLTIIDDASAQKLVQSLGGAPVLLIAPEGTYLAQVTPLLAALDDGKAEVWLKHPDTSFSYKLVLRDEPAFQAWLDDPEPGKVRIIQRADGYELTTGLGKLHGLDPNGPTVPVRGGKLDLATLQKGLDRVKERFKMAPELYFVPSYGTDLTQLARTVAANWLSDDQVVFSEQDWVYPRPVKELPKDAGKN
jgi:hypothetical protein